MSIQIINGWDNGLPIFLKFADLKSKLSLFAFELFMLLLKRWYPRVCIFFEKDFRFKY